MKISSRPLEHIIKSLFHFPRVRIPPVAGDTGDRRNGFTLVVFVEAKIFLVDLTGHPEHMTGDLFLGFCIACKVEPVRSAVT